MLAAFLQSRGGVRGLVNHPLVKDTLWLYGVQFSSYLFPLLTLPLLARVLGPEKSGLLVFAQSFIWYFVTLVDYGFALTATRKIATHREDVAKVSRIFSTVMASKLVLLAVSAVVMEGIILAVPKLRSDHALFWAAFLSVIGNVLFPVWYFQGMQRLEKVALRDFLTKFSALVLLFLLVREESDYLWAAAIQSGGMVISGMVGLAQVRGVMPLDLNWPSWAEIGRELREGWTIFLSMVMLTVNSTTNIFILGLVGTEAETGHYTSAFRVVVAIRMMVSPIVSVLYPHLSRMAAYDKDRGVEFLRKMGWLLAAPFGLISLGLLVGAPWVVPLVFGPGYEPTIPLMQILALSPFLLALSHNYSTYYMLPLGYDREWSRMVAWGVMLNFVLLGLLLVLMRPSYSIAVATVGVDFYSVVAAYLFYRKTSRA